MKRVLTALVAAAIAAIVLPGCAGIQVAKGFNGQKIDMQGSQQVAHVHGSNWGLYFLSTPLIAGSTDKVGTVEFMGKDTVKVGPVVDIVTKKSASLGASKTLDLQSNVSSFMLPFPIPFLFYINSVQVSGNAVK